MHLLYVVYSNVAHGLKRKIINAIAPVLIPSELLLLYTTNKQTQYLISIGIYMNNTGTYKGATV